MTTMNERKIEQYSQSVLISNVTANARPFQHFPIDMFARCRSAYFKYARKTTKQERIKEEKMNAVLTPFFLESDDQT